MGTLKNQNTRPFRREPLKVATGFDIYIAYRREIVRNERLSATQRLWDTNLGELQGFFNYLANRAMLKVEASPLYTRFRPTYHLRVTLQPGPLPVEAVMELLYYYQPAGSEEWKFFSVRQSFSPGHIHELERAAA